MKFSLNIDDYSARAFGLNTKEQFSSLAFGEIETDNKAPNLNPANIPMMTARRLSMGCRMAVDIGLELIKAHDDIDAVIYSSATGEEEHNYKVLESAAKGVDCSPTDFSMSVHNTAVGNFTILSKKKIPSSSVSAGTDSFLMALTDAYVMLSSGYKKILVVDYNVSIPPFFKNYLKKDFPDYPYSVGLVVSKGDDFEFTTSKLNQNSDHLFPVSLNFLLSLIKKENVTLKGERLLWEVTNKHE